MKNEDEKPKLLTEDLEQFWDNFNEDLHDEVHDGRVDFRTPKTKKVEFKKACKSYKGGMTAVMNKYMDFIINKEKSKTK